MSDNEITLVRIQPGDNPITFKALMNACAGKIPDDTTITFFHDWQTFCDGRISKILSVTYDNESNKVIIHGSESSSERRAW